MKTSQSAVHHLRRPDGALAFTDRGRGPLVVCVPGMGDIRSTWDVLAGALVENGFRVVALDIRGHGDSDTGFRRHGDAATAEDVLALVDELGEPAVLVGNSFAGSAAVIAAAQRPAAVAGLVLVSPFLRESSTPGQMRRNRLLFRLMFARPWGAAAWASYYGGPLTRGTRPAALLAHVAELRASFRNPARLRSLRELTLQLDHREVEPAVAAVTAPALILVGALDPDYADPATELVAMGSALGAETELVDDAAHYAHAQRPDVVVPRVLAFLATLPADSLHWTARA